MSYLALDVNLYASWLSHAMFGQFSSTITPPHTVHTHLRDTLHTFCTSHTHWKAVLSVRIQVSARCNIGAFFRSMLEVVEELLPLSNLETTMLE